MVETPSSEGIERMNHRDELTNKVSSTILKLFFKKQMEKMGESGEKPEQELHINIQGAIKGPDSFGNYVLSFDGKKILLDENLNDVTGLEFVGITPYNDRYYVCDIGKKCVFYDTQTRNVVEFAKTDQTYSPKIYGKEEMSDDEFLTNLCETSMKLSPGEHKNGLLLCFYGFLNKYFQNIIGKNADIKSRIGETSAFGRECEAMLKFLLGAYEYMYNGEITHYLAGKDSAVWEKLKESEVLKETFPDLYLAMKELDFLKNVLIDTKGNICGYIIIKSGVCSYITPGGTISEYDDFIGPDKHGNIITQKGNKKYFINSDFQYPFFGFDDIIGPDKNGIYIFKTKKKKCLVSSTTGKLFSLSDSSTVQGNEPDFITECFDLIEGPDPNNNYMIKNSKGYFLLNSKGEKITDEYLKLEFIAETKNYGALNMSGKFSIDKNGNTK